MLGSFIQSIFHRFVTAPDGIQEVEKLREHDPYYGWSPSQFALIFGMVSGLSLPIAAILGVVVSPDQDDESEEGKAKVRTFDKQCALMMAFGAGALLFAVTVELYGHALHEVAAGHLGLGEMFTIIFGALCGGAFYLTISQWLDEYLTHEAEHDALEDASSAASTAATAKDPEAQKQSQPSEETPLLVAQADQAGAASGEKKSAKKLWGVARKVKQHVSVKLQMKKMLESARQQGLELRGRDKALLLLDKDAQHAKSVALALFVGLLVDGVPEGVLMGFLAAEGHLTPALIISLFVANFPEAFSSASLFKKAKIGTPIIVGMWTGLCLLVGCLAGLACYLLLLNFPHFGAAGHSDHKLPMGVLIGIALTEGVTGGSMIACISSVMLPEAFERAGKEGPFYSQSGFLCLSGFLLSAAMKATFG